MPKQAKELSAVEVRRLTKPGLWAVGGVTGLYLQVKESSARSWILRTVIGERRPDIGLGGFPDVTLDQARKRARETRDLIRQGVDPVAHRKAAADALRVSQSKFRTFDEIAKLAHVARSAEFRSAKHRKQWIVTLETYASPLIGSASVASVEVPQVIEVLQPLWRTKPETASRLRARMEAVFAYAIAQGYREGDNPARWKGCLEHALPRPSKVHKVEHHAALPWRDVGAFMPVLRGHHGTGAKALEFAILTAARSGEVRLATWGEIDLGAKLWTVPAHRMKAGKAHKVPLSDPAAALLRGLPQLAGCDLVFPSKGCRPLSDNTLSKLLRDMGVDATPHGFRSSFKDWARSNTSFADEVTELALAHVNSDATRAAYARDELLPKRARLMRDWAKFLSSPMRVASVTPIRAKA